MTSVCDQISDEWELYVLGTLTSGEHDRMRSHLASGCPLCQEQYWAAQSLVSSIGTLAPEAHPSPELEQRLRARLEPKIRVSDFAPTPLPFKSKAAPRPSRPFVNSLPWCIAAGALFVAFLSQQHQRRLSSQLETSQAVIATLQTRNAAAAGATVKTTALPPGPQQKETDEPKKDAGLLAQVAELQRTVDQLSKSQVSQSQVSPGDDLTARLAMSNASLAALQSELSQAKQETVAAQKDKAESSARLAALNVQLSRRQAEVASLQQAIARQSQLVAFFRSRGIRQTELRSVDQQAGGATARGFYAPGVGVLLLADSLPKLDDQKCYQLWAIRKSGKPINSAGILTVDNAGNGYLFVKNDAALDNLTGLAITAEPAGGSVSAQGRKLLFGVL